MENEKQIDILTIGDIATEPFIKIREAEATCDPDGDHCKLCINFGGKIPYESAEVCHAVGNSSNVAIGASRLGLSSCLVSYVGNDTTGKEDIELLEEEKVNTDYIRVVNGMESNYHYVLWYGVERTILVKHTEFPYSLPDDLVEPKWIYFSSLAPNSEEYHHEISNYLKSHPNVSLAFQPGTFQIKLGTEKLKDIYANTKIFFCNLNEAQRILETDEEDIPKLLRMISALGPKMVVITNGIKGAYCYDGNQVLFMKAFPKRTVESTGAGDAFASAFLSALILEKNTNEALMWGATNAMSVVCHIGPHKGLLTRNQIEEYIKKLPEDSGPTVINN
ncbi:MAG TPA: carbohydrate kinase family protein [Candidatus Paceibacterota bacterium]|nr:carbohydrate kinase family protein [Candidatus Paceibacterota bacterium]